MRTLLALFMLPLLTACGTKTPLKLPPTTTALMTSAAVAISHENLLRAVLPARPEGAAKPIPLWENTLGGPAFLHGNHNNNAAASSQCI